MLRIWLRACRRLSPNDWRSLSSFSVSCAQRSHLWAKPFQNILFSRLGLILAIASHSEANLRNRSVVSILISSLGWTSDKSENCPEVPAERKFIPIDIREFAASASAAESQLAVQGFSCCVTSYYPPSRSVSFDSKALANKALANSVSHRIERAFETIRQQ
jgi:hypothetical protein